MGDWLEFVVHAPRGREDDCAAALEAAGALSVTYEDDADQPVLEPPPGETPLWSATRVVGLFPADTDTAPLVRTLTQHLGETPPWETRALPDRDWTLAWADHFRPMRFGEGLWVVPSSEAPPEEGTVLRLDPGLAFGTGTHPTTALCLTWLDRHRDRLPGARVIDYGCGSGILAIAAALLGAQRVDAVDIDPQALTATRENAAKNAVAERIEARLPEPPPEPGADLLVANILAKPLLELRPLFARLVRPGGTVVLSGLLGHQGDAVAAAYAADFVIVHREIDADWACLELRRKTRDRNLHHPAPSVQRP